MDERFATPSLSWCTDDKSRHEWSLDGDRNHPRSKCLKAIRVLVAYRRHSDEVVLAPLAVVCKGRPSLRFSEMTFTKMEKFFLCGLRRISYGCISALAASPCLQTFAGTASGDVLNLPICMWLMAEKEPECFSLPHFGAPRFMANHLGTK